MDFESISKYLAEKEIRSACEVCGQSAGWTVHGAGADSSPEAVTLGIPYFRTGENGKIDEMYLASMLIIALECGHCSHLRMFNKWTMRDKMSKEMGGKLPPCSNKEESDVE